MACSPTPWSSATPPASSMSASMACAGSTPNVWSTHSIRSPTPNAPRRAAFAPSSGGTTAVSRLGAAIPPRRARRPCRRGSIASSAAGPASPPSTVCSRACAPTRANCSRCSNGPISRSTPTAPRTTFVARSPSARSAAEPAATPAATAATPSSASTKPAPSSASPSGTTSAHASKSQDASKSQPSPKSSARAPQGHPNRRDCCPCYPQASTVMGEKLAHAPRLSIVVLPFANLSGDPEQDYFADGLTDDLTTDLSNLPGSFLIAHNTALTYKGKPADVKEIGRELGVRYAVEGSVRRVGETITINAQLLSTETGAHVWADRFEGDRGKLGELQVEAVARIANALGVQLVNAEALRALRERPNNPDAVDLAMRGSAALYKGMSPESANKAIGYFD